MALVFTREPAFAEASAAKPAIALASVGAALFQLARVPGRREPGSPYRAVTSRCGGDATILLRLRDRLRRRPSNEQN